MYNFVIKPFSDTNKFLTKLMNLKNNSSFFVSYQLGVPKRHDDSAMSVSLMGYHENDFYVILITTGWHCGDVLFQSSLLIPDIGYTEYLDKIITHMISIYAEETYLTNKIKEVLDHPRKTPYDKTVSFDEIRKTLQIPYAEPICTVLPDSKAYKRLEAAAALIQAETDKNCIVKECFYDMGQDWMWTTILCESGMQTFPYMQILNPKQQKLIIFGSLKQFQETVLELIEKNK